MKQTLIDILIYGGSALIAYCIYRYVRFARQIRAHGNWDRERRVLRLPILLLVLFLAGYLAVGLLGQPDLVIAAILFGGSIFVLLMLLMMQRTAARIQENERLEARLSAAEEASRAKTFFLSNMSHDIRTPLNAIIGYTALARREGTPDETKDEYIAKIDMAGRQLLDIVNDVLEMSRIESGRLTLEPEPTDLEQVVHDAGDLVRMQLHNKHIRFSSDTAIEHRWVLCDRNQLNRALMNLLCNAGKFTGEGGQVTLSLQELSAREDQAHYRICVRDTGIGMSPDFVEHLFTPFEREQTSTISKIQGTGLGMAITKAILDEMGGHIEVETAPGKGTAFFITLSLPLTEAPAAEPSAPDESGPAHARLLMAEDNPVNREIAQLILTQAGYLVDSAENGQEALDMLTAAEDGRYGAVLMDIQMPVMDGYAAARAIRALPDARKAAIPIVAMTANAFQEDIRAAEEAGMNGHIAKPLDVDEMLDTLRRVLREEDRQTGN